MLHKMLKFLAMSFNFTRDAIPTMFAWKVEKMQFPLTSFCILVKKLAFTRKLIVKTAQLL